MLKKIRYNLLSRSGAKTRGQSLLELALVLPVLILILLGLVEVSIFIGRYLDALDLTREAARFASVRDPFTSIDTPILVAGDDANPHDSRRDLDCSDSNQFFFYYQTACIFSPPINQACRDNDDPFCEGMNPYLAMDLAFDDVLISAFTVDGGNQVTNVHPRPGGDPRISGSSYVDEGGLTSYYWALSDHDADSTHNANWSKDCRGNLVPGKIPYYSLSRAKSIIGHTSLNDAGGNPVYSPGSKGFVAVEIYYCYTQALGLPVFTTFVPNPMMIHAYTLMPLPAAAPTPTPKTNP